jgi:hypothetical protein
VLTCPLQEKGSLRCELCGSPYRPHLLPALEPLAAAAAARRKQQAQLAQEAQEGRAAAALTGEQRYKQRVKCIMLWWVVSPVCRVWCDVSGNNTEHGRLLLVRVMQAT